MYPQGIHLVHDTWNTVHGERFMLTLIEIAKAQFGVDPDRVYTMGFSMGGTGSWFMAGRHPDLLAGSAPCAGVLMASPRSQLETKEEVQAVQHGLVPNVRNLAMYYYIGLADKNCMPGTYLYVADMLDALRAADPGGYTKIRFTTHPGLPHAQPRGEPKAMLEWLPAQKRETFPMTVVWELATDPFPNRADDDPLGRVPKRALYWLGCSDPVDSQRLRATREGNEFVIETARRSAGHRGLALWLNPAMIDVTQDVVVRVGDEEVYRGKPKPSLAAVLESMDMRVDRAMVFDRRIDL
jgi:pimeloyl-ACP methyl ester carboxylesterase